MQRLDLEVKPRDLGEKTANKNLNQLRREGWIPGVIYGHGNSVSIAIDSKLFAKALHTKAGVNALFNVSLGSEKSLGIVKNIQRDIFTQVPIHVDLQRINVKEKLEISVPVHLTGEAPGVKTQGGILELIQREIRVKCLPDNIPASIDVDISNLTMGHAIKLAEVKAPEGVEFITTADHIIVTVVAPKIEEEVKPAAGAATAEGAAAQPEVIAKGKKDEEGAAPAAGGAAPAAGAKAAAPAAKEEKKK